MIKQFLHTRYGQKCPRESIKKGKYCNTMLAISSQVLEFLWSIFQMGVVQNENAATTLTLFIMTELIINLKLATAGPRHLELQKYPPKRKSYLKNSYFTWDSNLGPVKLQFEVYCSTISPTKQHMKLDNEFFMSYFHGLVAKQQISICNITGPRFESRLKQ